MVLKIEKSENTIFIDNIMAKLYSYSSLYTNPFTDI